MAQNQLPKKNKQKNPPNWKALKHDMKSRDNLSKTMCHLVLNRVVPLSVWCQTHSPDVCLRIAGNPKTNESAWPYRNTPTQARGGCKGLPGAARWLGCAASLCTAGPPGWELAVGDQDSGPEDWTTFSCTGQPEAKKTTRCQQWNIPSQIRPAS